MLSLATLRNKSGSAIGEFAFVFKFGGSSFRYFDLDIISAVFNSPGKPMSPKGTLGGHLCLQKLIETRLPTDTQSDEAAVTPHAARGKSNSYWPGIALLTTRSRN